MWTATIQQVNKDDATAVVLFTDGVKYKRQETIPLNGLTPETFRARVESMRANFDRSFTFIDSLNPSFDLTPTPTPEPTPEEVKQQAVNAKKLKIIQSKIELDLNLISQAEYDKLFQEYKDLIAT